MSSYGPVVWRGLTPGGRFENQRPVGGDPAAVSSDGVFSLPNRKRLTALQAAVMGARRDTRGMFGEHRELSLNVSEQFDQQVGVIDDAAA